MISSDGPLNPLNPYLIIRNHPIQLIFCDLKPVAGFYLYCSLTVVDCYPSRKSDFTCFPCQVGQRYHKDLLPGLVKRCEEQKWKKRTTGREAVRPKERIEGLTETRTNYC